MRFLCPLCHATSELADTVGGQQTDCPACGGRVVIVPTLPRSTIQPLEPRSAPQSTPEESTSPAPGGRFTFGLSSLMLVVTLVAVTLGVAGVSPGLGILLAILALPATVRTGLSASRLEQQKGRPMNVADKVLAFLESLLVVVVIGVAATGAFAVTCFSIGLAGFKMNKPGQSEFPIYLGLAVGLAVGLLAAGVAGFFTVRWLWPRRE